MLHHKVGLLVVINTLVNIFRRNKVCFGWSIFHIQRCLSSLITPTLNWLNETLDFSTMTAINWIWQTQKYWNTKGEKKVCGERSCEEAEQRRHFSAVRLLLRSGLLACNLIISHSCIKSLFAHNSKHIDLGAPAWTWRSTSSHSGERSSVPFKPWSERNTDGAQGEKKEEAVLHV